MSIDDTLFDPEKEQLDQAQVKHHLAAPAANNSNTINGSGMPGPYNVVDTSEFFHSHESDSHVLNYSEYETSHVADQTGISDDLSAVLPVDVTFAAPAQLYHPHVTPYWTQHVTNHVADSQRVTPVKRRDLNEIAGMKLPELKAELKRYVFSERGCCRGGPVLFLARLTDQSARSYRLSSKGTKPQLVQRLFRHLSLFHSHVPGPESDSAPFIFAEPWPGPQSTTRHESSLTALFEDDQLAQESYLAQHCSELQARDAQPLDLSSLSLLSLPEIKARLAQYTGASIKGSKAELIQRLVRYSCLFGNHAHK